MPLSWNECPGHAPSPTATNNNTTTADAPPLWCSHCVQRALAQSRQRYLTAYERHQQACHTYHQESPLILPTHRTLVQLPQIVHTTLQLRERLEILRQQSSTLALQVAQSSMDIDTRRRRLEQDTTHVTRTALERWRHSHMESLHACHAEWMQRVQSLRYHWALLAFELHQLHVVPTTNHDTRSSSSIRQARGIGKIAGLPLPHAGPTLYSVLPTRELESALRLVASLTKLVAQCLGIRLPHPIVSSSSATNNNNGGDLAVEHDLMPRSCEASEYVWTTFSPWENTTTAAAVEGTLKETDVSSSQTWTSWLLDKAAHGMKPSKSPPSAGSPPSTTTASTRSHVPPSMDPAIVQQRIQACTYAIFTEDTSPHSSRYVLTTSQPEAWTIALQLLQNNIVALCVRAGVSVSTLWPAEAVLLNLQALRVHCAEQVE
jgi:hypothetical protein